MTATLSFNLPEETTEHRTACHAQELASALCAIKRDLRIWLKHGHTFNTPNDALEAVRALLIEETEGLPEGII